MCAQPGPISLLQANLAAFSMQTGCFFYANKQMQQKIFHETVSQIACFPPFSGIQVLLPVLMSYFFASRAPSKHKMIPRSLLCQSYNSWCFTIGVSNFLSVRNYLFACKKLITGVFHCKTDEIAFWNLDMVFRPKNVLFWFEIIMAPDRAKAKCKKKRPHSLNDSTVPCTSTLNLQRESMYSWCR